MKPISLFSALALVALAGGSALAQQPAAKKATNPVRDSMKALTKDIKQDRADLKKDKTTPAPAPTK